MTESPTLRMQRTYQAPAQAVFDAWTSEDVMRRWWHAEHGWETTEATVDLRVGGTVRVVMRDPAGLHVAVGWQRHPAADRTRLRGGRRCHHHALHPPRAVGRGGGALARGRLGQGVREFAARARGDARSRRRVTAAPDPFLASSADERSLPRPIPKRVTPMNAVVTPPSLRARAGSLATEKSARWRRAMVADVDQRTHRPAAR